MSYRTSHRVAILWCLLAPLSFLAPDSLSGDITVGGNRPVTVRVPTSYDPDVPTPLRVRVSDLALGTGEPVRRMLRGDCSGEGIVDITDAVCLLNWLFLDSPPPDCLAAANANGDASLDITDAGYLLNFLFSGGAAPVAPFPGCGSIASAVDTALGCVHPPASCEVAR